MLASGLPVAALLLPGPPEMLEPIPVLPRRTSLPLAVDNWNQPGVVDIALSARIPVYRVGRLTSDQTLSHTRGLSPDYLLSVCYPRLISGVLPRVLKVPALNVHPSRLPHLRGPDPMFWTFRNFTGQSGVTIHALSARFDAGPVAARQNYQVPPGVTESELESELARIATDLLTDLASSLASGSLDIKAQDEEQATYAPFPEPRDFRIVQHMSARAAYAFFHGIRGRNVPILIDIAETRYIVRDVARENEHTDEVRRVRFADDDLYLSLQATPV